LGLEKKGWASLFYAIGVGAFAFFSFIGAGALLPKNIAWLNEGDPATFYLGWSFFRHTPWSIPLGLNPNYGLELSSSILFSDSNPLFAFLFKPFSAILPEPFQYFGLWLLLCLVLQAWFAYQLMSLISKNGLIRLLGASFFVCAPTLIWRMQGHYSLSGHFLILAALYLVLMPSSRRRTVYWTVLLVIAALIHPYLLVMVGALWCADCVDRLIQTGWSVKCLWLFLSLLLEGAIIFSLVFLAGWQAGYFAASSDLISSGYGEYRMNVLSIIDPHGFSYLLPDLAKNGNSFEGFNYLGLGVILLGCSILFYALPTSFTKCTQLIFRGIGKWPALALGLLCLTAFAITHLVGIGSFEYILNLPQSIINIANHFRASGRMFWPAYYLLILTILYFVIRLFSTRVTIILLTLAVLIQYIDTSKMWLDLRAKYSAPPSTAWPSPITDSFWQAASLQYKQVRVLMPSNSEQHWQEIASYASAHQMPTDATYLARVSNSALKKAEQTAKTAILTGNYDLQTLYFIVGPTLSANDQQPLIYVNAQKDLLARVDGFAVLAPNWKTCVACPAVTSEITAQDPSMVFGQRVIFGRDVFQTKLYLGDGWSAPEDAGVWSEGLDSTLTVPVKNGRIQKIMIEAFPMIHPLHIEQAFEVKMNGMPVSTVTLSGSSNAQFIIEIPEKLRAQLPRSRQLLTLQFHFLNPVRPIDLGLGDDTRRLGFQLRAMTIIGE